MCEERSARLLLLISLILLLVLPTSSSAYLDEIWLVNTDVELINGPGTIRLAGMGNLTIAIEDENNEVNLYDFTGNVASLILDKDTRNADSWAGYSTWHDSKDGVRWQDMGIWESGGLVVLRGEDYAGGASFAARLLDLYRVNDEGFRNILRIGFPISEVAVPDTSFIDTEVTSNVVEGYYAHKLLGMAFVGARGWGSFEGDDKPVTFYYDMGSKLNDVGVGLGVVLVPFDWVQIGGSVDFGSQAVEVSSKDAFHDDLYKRERSTTTLSSHALLSLMGKVRGVMNYKHFSFDADQTLNMNWSDLYILNPEDVDVRQKLKVSAEATECDFFATRWIVSDLGLPLTVSGYFDLMQEEAWEYAEPNVLLWIEEYDEVMEQWNLGGGASYHIGGKATVGMEVRVNRGKQESRLPHEEGRFDFKAVDIRGGGELRLLNWLALRGGFSQCSEERRMGIPENDFTATTYTVGAGCYLLENQLTVDAAFLNKVTEPEQDLGAGRETTYQALMIYGRFLF
ncbi:MAG: hypothetical protein AMJ46_13760 [Latescibacteria bacterium DG_63]|nr:MAG: hypothetical protein AMJ46_13760 [Latescibacteria bacterium DG_63]